MAQKNRIEFAVRVKDDASANLQRISKEVTGVGDSLKRLAGIALSGFGALEALRLADTYRLLQNRLKLVTKGSEELKTVTEELVAVSFRARTSFTSTADLYARVARSSRTLGLSQQELIDFTETVSKSITISGSTAQEAAAGVIQFGQALASSRLSGDELRSVLEQMPRLAQAIAEGMGVGIGRLREMGEAGELSATRVLESLRKAAPAIAKEFAELAPLLSQGFTLLESATTIAIGNIDAMLGASKMLASVVIETAEQIVLLGDALTGNLSEEKLSKINTATQTLAISLLSIGFAIGSIKDALDIGTSPFDLLQNVVSRMTEVAAQGGGPFMTNIDDVTKGIRLAWEDTIEEVSDDWETGVDGMTDRMEAFAVKIKAIFGEINARGGIDLTGAAGADDETTRKQRDAMASAFRNLDNMRKALIQQQQAMFIAAEGALKYSDALQLVKLRAFGAASGNMAATNEAEALFNALIVGKEILADNAAVEALEEELRLIKMTNQQRFVYIELQKLSKNASDAQINAVMDASIELFDLQEKLAATATFTEQVAEQAAKNMQTAFSDFFFDPFQEGLDGLLISFLNVMRRMIAEILAAQVLQSSGISTFLGNLVGVGIGSVGGDSSGGSTGLAVGGPILGGQPVLVGERGPEIFMPSGAGTIKNNSASKALGGGMPQFVTNIDARGADPGLIARLPVILDARDRQLLVTVQRFMDTGVMPI